MISPALSPKSLALVLVIFTIFTVSLTENLQLADGLTQIGNRLIYELDVGESQVLQWGMKNTLDTPIEIQFYATGTGSELMHFEEFATLEAGEFRNFDFIVVVPEDHKDNVEYHITLNALDRGSPLEDGETGIQVMAQMTQQPRIYIGDNPVYTYELPPQVEITNEEIIVTPNTGLAAGEGLPTGETLEEKLARIAAANLKEETQEVAKEIMVTETPEVKDSSYIEEPIVDAEPTSQASCGFWEWFLSLFGIESDCI